jgi:hypothetical protein
MTNLTEQLNTLLKEYHALAGANKEFISEYETRIKNLRVQYLQIAELYKPIKTIPAIFKRSYDENFISDYLAYILNPTESGLGLTPIQTLLCNAGCSICLTENDIIGIQVVREYQLSNESRIDILIILKKIKLLIAIENKIYSSEGYNQTIRYSESIQEMFPAYTQILLYLTPTGEKPASSEFKPISYGNLYSLLRTTDKPDITAKDQFIYQDFLQHVENYIMTSVNLKLSEKSLLYLKNAELIEDLTQAFTEDSKMVFQVLSEIIKGIFESISEDWQFNFTDRGCQQIWKKHWESNQVWVHFEFWFTKESLFTDSQFQFMVDAEGKEKETFISKFEPLQSKIKSKYQNAGIQYRPKSRKLAIAYKEHDYQLTPDKLDRSEIESYFRKIITDFVFLIEPIDQAFEKIKTKAV